MSKVKILHAGMHFTFPDGRPSFAYKGSEEQLQYILDNKDLYSLVAEFEHPAKNTDALLDKAYLVTNSVDRPWVKNNGLTVYGYRHRSTSVGDIIIVNNVYFVVSPFGFDKMSLHSVSADST